MSFNASEEPLDYLRGFTMTFDMWTGLSPDAPTGKRCVSDLKAMFCDGATEAALIKNGNPLVYEFHTLPTRRTRATWPSAVPSSTRARWGTDTS